MPRPIPAWKAQRNEAMAAWRASISPEMRAEIDAAWTEAKANAVARKAARIERDRRILALAVDGLMVAEIAGKIGMQNSLIYRRLAELGIEASRPRLRRAPPAWIKPETRTALDALAAERGVGASEIMERALNNLFEDGAAKARNLLRHDFLRVVEGRAA